ncbi:MAG: stage III sporulation protein AB [Oscillospiraceae bacterium]|nr:stage III sporulation protein AB [Oscillospiraceae bacterium]
MERKGFDGAAALLPPSLRENMYELLSGDRLRAEEIRLRLGRRPTVVLPEGEIAAGRTEVTGDDIAGVLDIATGASVHTAHRSMAQGFVTARGGYRVGICGTAVVHAGEVTGFRALSSASIRIPRQIYGVAEQVLGGLFENGRFLSTLIISPPGCGKTTLLRDIICRIASGSMSMRVSLADERSEVAAVFEGKAQLDVGEKTDIMDGCPKAQASMLLLRAMNPQVIAMDEITSPEDIDAIVMAANCGVELLATAHGSDQQDLYRRGLYRRLLETSVFRRAVVISLRGGSRAYKVFRQEAGKWSEL